MARPVTEFRLERLDLEEGPVALVTMDDGAGDRRPNVFGRAALESLARLLPELYGGAFSALVITGKPGSFSGGADLDELPRIKSREQALEASRTGHELFARLRALPYPTVAAVNGPCLGGGVELALHCDYRAIASTVSHFASPECLLGVVPAWGATQLAPRLAGAQAAVELIVSNPMRQNRMLSAEQASELGFVDRVADPERLIEEALALTSERPTRTEADLSDVEKVAARARAQLDDSLHAAAPAPYAALELIAGSARWSLEEGYRAEEDAFAELLATRQAQASLYAFDLVERRVRHATRPMLTSAGASRVEPRRVSKVGIAGAGLMATQLATLFLRRLGVPVVLHDLDDEIVTRALEMIRDELAGAAARGRIDQETAVSLASQVAGTTSYEGFENCGLVIEAVFEELAVKQQVFAELEKVVPPPCVLATNTSALSVTAMAESLSSPERLLGMHFFNPVALMPLVELVRTPETDDVSLTTAWEVATRLRKRPVLVNDAPGFVVNRLLTRMMTIVLEALETGNSVEETDEALLSLGLPMAPSVLLQIVGPGVANHVLETLHASSPERFPLSETLANYAAGRSEIAVREQSPRSELEIRESALEALADECQRLLAEGVVASAKDVDTALILGAGFPFFLGGITKYLDQTGVSERVLGRELADQSYEMSSSKLPFGSLM